MDPSPLPPEPDEPPRIADAEALLQADSPAPAAVRLPTPTGPGEILGYEVGPAVESAQAAPRLAPTPEAPPRAGPSSKASAPPRRASLAPEEAVEQVWSRWGEWGGSLVTIGCASVGVLLALYVLVSLELYGTALLGLVVGGLALLVLSYPIFITLERPVRVTPEQAVRDYFGALSHHRPHYRRMWLLLSQAGKVSGSFASYEGFRSYWDERQATLRAGRAAWWTPLKFQVTDFRSEKSAGQTAIDATFAVRVFVRGRQAEGPFDTFKVATTLAKGPDRMWYLDRGTLP